MTEFVLNMTLIALPCLFLWSNISQSLSALKKSAHDVCPTHIIYAQLELNGSVFVASTYQHSKLKESWFRKYGDPSVLLVSLISIVAGYFVHFHILMTYKLSRFNSPETFSFSSKISFTLLPMFKLLIEYKNFTKCVNHNMLSRCNSINRQKSTHSAKSP